MKFGKMISVSKQEWENLGQDSIPWNSSQFHDKDTLQLFEISSFSSKVPSYMMPALIITGPQSKNFYESWAVHILGQVSQ